MMNGKSAKPAVSTTPATPTQERTNAMPGAAQRRSDEREERAAERRERRRDRPRMLRVVVSQPAGSRSTVFAVGANDESGDGIVTIW